MKLFGRSGGYYLFWISAVYLTFGLTLISLGLNVYIDLLSPIWVSVLSLPFIIPPFGRWLNLNVEWDRKMNFLSWLGLQKIMDDTDPKKVVNFPAPKSVPYVEPPKKEEPPKTFYRLGLTDNNRVSFHMGYSEITMNAEGCQQMIDQLEFFKGQLYDEGPSGGPDDDGGEPIPVPEQKAA